MQKRIFWLGAHVVLVATELPQLRALGYEVYNPPYRSSLYDQSAVRDWDANQKTTLPPEIFNELSQYNFFFNPISPRIAEILNTYFDTVIVTNASQWLKEIFKVFKGQIIYRTYGQIIPHSGDLRKIGLKNKIINHPNFMFMPHAEEAIECEEIWLKERMKIVPYTTSPDIFDYKDTWSVDERHAYRIMGLCPNLDNSFYTDHYEYLRRHFPQSFIRLYGVQPSATRHLRIMGTLPRKELIPHFQKSSGYMYTYDQPTICFLPPIEMMIVGGPVIFMKGSLLANYFKGKDIPGLAKDPWEADEKMRYLLKGDKSFISEVIESQKAVRERYFPEHVNPLIQEAFPPIFNQSANSTNKNISIKRTKFEVKFQTKFVLRQFKKVAKKVVVRVLS